jgi:hypothetical protein
MRAWATPTTQLSATERDTILENLSDLERVTRTLIAAEAAIETSPTPTSET